MKGVMEMMKLKKMMVLILALGVLALGSTFAAAGAGNQPALPDEIVAALDGDVVMVLYDAEGGVVWSSDSEEAFDPALLEQVARVVISDAEGNVIEDLPVVTGPNDNLVVEYEDGYFGLGMLLKEFGVTGVAPEDGTGMQNQNQEQHQYKEEHQEQHQTKGECTDGCQNQHKDDHAAHHGAPKTDSSGE